MTKRVLITYPNGTECVAEVVQREDYAWVRGHGELARLIDQQQCTIVPLVSITPERIEALEETLRLAKLWCTDYHTHYFGNVRVEECSDFEILRELMKEVKP